MQDMLRALHVTMGQVARLEEAWKTNPNATLDTLVQPGPDEDPEPVALKCVPRCLVTGLSCAAVCCINALISAWLASVLPASAIWCQGLRLGRVLVQVR